MIIYVFSNQKFNATVFAHDSVEAIHLLLEELKKTGREELILDVIKIEEINEAKILELGVILK